MQYIVSAMLVLAAVIHLMPLPGVLGSKRLHALYGLTFDEPNLLILMRHRAVLFGMLGVSLLFAAFWPPVQDAAIIAGFVSIVSFLWIARSVGGYNGHVARICKGDVVALVCLIIGAAVRLYLRGQG